MAQRARLQPASRLTQVMLCRGTARALELLAAYGSRASCLVPDFGVSLHYACRISTGARTREVVSALLAAGAPHSAAQDMLWGGFNIASRQFSSGTVVMSMTPLITASVWSIELVAPLLAAGADVNVVGYYVWPSPLHACCDHPSKLPTVELFLSQHWINMNTVDYMGRTPLLVSASGGKSNLPAVLAIARHAKADLTAADLDGHNVLHLIARWPESTASYMATHAQVAEAAREMLARLSVGAVHDMLGARAGGHTPLEIAHASGNAPLAGVLREAAPDAANEATAAAGAGAGAADETEAGAGAGAEAVAEAGAVEAVAEAGAVEAVRAPACDVQ